MDLRFRKFLSHVGLLLLFSMGEKAMSSSAEYVIKTETVPTQTAAIVKREVGFKDVGTEVESSIKKVQQYLTKHGIKPVGAPLTRTLEISNGRISFEAGFPVQKASTSREISFVTIPGSLVATTVHRGKSEDSEKGYEALHQWMKTNSRHPAGPPWEVYLGHNETQIYFPIQ